MVQKKTLKCGCGAILPLQKTGRPKKRCGPCETKYRKEYKASRYLHQKYVGLSEEEIQRLELKEEIRRDRNKVSRFLRWKLHYTHVEHRKGIAVIFRGDLTLGQRERICGPIRRKAMKELQDSKSCSEPLT
jgi:hypothetical protein